MSLTPREPEMCPLREDTDDGDEATQRPRVPGPAPLPNGDCVPLLVPAAPRQSARDAKKQVRKTDSNRRPTLRHSFNG